MRKMHCLQFVREVQKIAYGEHHYRRTISPGPSAEARRHAIIRRLHNVKRTTGADIPVDLFDLILSFITVDSSGLMTSSPKGNLVHIALVCRRWASICQSKIFEKITLRSCSDFDDLWSFITRPGSVIPRSLCCLCLQPANFVTSAPWIHQVCQKIPSRSLHSRFRIELTLEGQERVSLVMGKSIHSSLPRHHPVLSSGIQSLSLRNVHFRRLEDLARLVGEMPSLQRLNCYRVTWPPQPDEQPQLASFVTRRSRPSIVYNMTYCTDNVAAVLLSSQTVPVRGSRLCVHDVHAMQRMLRVLPFLRSFDAVESCHIFNGADPGESPTNHQ